jgi:DDE superfamily endonuclease
MWCIPPKHSAAFVSHMEDGLAVSCRPLDPARPVVCLDETFKQLIGETREPLPPKPGAVERDDHVSVRHGVASLFLACEPLRGWRLRGWRLRGWRLRGWRLRGWRHVAVTAQRRRSDWAHVVRALLDGRYRDAERIVLVMDQLNTHSAASLYDAFPPDEARRLAERLEIHQTPKHGSWLNMAEIELSALARQALARRLACQDTLERRVEHGEAERNAARTTVDWQFTTENARTKRRTLYPSLQD